MAIDDTLAQTHYVLGLLYKKSRRYAEAVKNLRRAVSIYEEKNMAALVYDPASFHRISAYYALSELYADQGDTKTAQELLRKATMAALGIEEDKDKKTVYRSEDLMIYE